MPLTPTADTLEAASTGSYGVGAFNVIHLEHAEAIAAGAEQAERPAVLQISQNCVSFHGALEPLALATKAVAQASSMPVSLHLDHAESPELVEEAVRLGFSSVMFDASQSPYHENVARTREVVARCHRHGVLVEAELGEIGGKEGAHAPGVRTDPAEAAKFVAATGVDALAVAVGSSHAMTTRTAELDHDLISALRRAVPVPLVLHGSSGVSNAGLAHAVRSGMTKVNVATHLNAAYTSAIRERLATDPSTTDPRKYVAPGRTAIATEVANLLGILGNPAA